MLCQEKVTFLKSESTWQPYLQCGPARCCSSNLHFAETGTKSKSLHTAAKRGGPPSALCMATCKNFGAGTRGRNSELDQETEPTKKNKSVCCGEVSGETGSIS